MHAFAVCAVVGFVRVVLLVGVYTTGGPANGTLRNDVLQCDPGHYCTSGVMSACPSGRFACSPFVSDPLCSGPCSPGYYCEAGSDSSSQFECGSKWSPPSSVYCPGNSSWPTPVSMGYESIGGLTHFVRSAQIPCVPGSYCVNGTRSLCPAGRYGSSELLSSPLCDGVCLNGYECDEGSSVPDPRRCSAGFVCFNGTKTACPAGRYNTEVGSSSLDACVACPENTANGITGQASGAACVPCVFPEGSLAGAIACWPGVLVVNASDPVPVVPDFSAGDAVTVLFTRATNTPSVDTPGKLAKLLQFSTNMGSAQRASWSNGGTLLTVVFDDVSDVLSLDDVQIGRLSLTLLDTGGLMSSDLRSSVHPNRSITVTGTWGERFPPGILNVTAVNSGGQAGLGAGDSVLVFFDCEVRMDAVNVSSTAGLSKFIQFQPAIGVVLTGAWLSRFALLVTVVSPPVVADASALRVSAVSVRTLASGGLTSYNGQSLPSNATAVVGYGSWGDAPSMRLAALSGSAIQVLLSAPPFHAGYSITRYVLQWQPVLGAAFDWEGVPFPPSFDGLLHVNSSSPSTVLTGDTGIAVVLYALDAAQTVVVDIAGLTAGVSYAVRGACNNGGDVGPIVTPSPSTATPLAPMISHVSLPGALFGVMGCDGGEAVSIVGQRLGRLGAAVDVWYTNGNLTMNATGCVVVQDQSSVTCFTAAGVGRWFSFVVAVGGVHSAPSASLLSYAAPIVNSFSFPGGSAAMRTQGL